MRIVQNVFLPNAATIAAEAIGAFAARGVEVVTTFTASSLDQRVALLAGEADVAVTALDNLFAWNTVDETGFRAVAQIERTTSLPLYLAAGLTDVADLTSLDRPRVVVDSTASGFGIALVAIVESLGIGPDRMDIIGAGGVKERLAALAAGDGDVALLAPFVAGAAAEVGLVRAAALEDSFPSYPGLVVATHRRRYDELDGALRAFLGALAAGRNWLIADPDGAVAALVATGLREAAARDQLGLCGAGPLLVSPDGFEVLRRVRESQGLLPSIPCTYDDFVDHRFLED